MLTLNSLIAQLRPLLHPMLVHFPIALLFASVALDWLGYMFKHPNLTRAGFYTLVLGAFAAGISALSGPDHATGDASVPALLAAHQTWASITVGIAVALTAVRFVAARGLRHGAALIYLAATLALLVAVSLTGYFGGEMTYHHAVGVAVNNVPVASAGGDSFSVRPLIPAKPFVALVGLLAVVGFCLCMSLGRRLFPTYYQTWWRAVRQDLANAGAPLWTLQRGSVNTASPTAQAHQWARQSHDLYPDGSPRQGVQGSQASQLWQAPQGMAGRSAPEDERTQTRSPWK